jgi:hypothetical protein
VRDEPWADVDSGFRYSFCEGCGNLTIHSYNPATGFGQVFMLDASAMALLRVDVGPGAVSAYLFSDDYAQNSPVTRPLFRGYLRSVSDGSKLANGFIDLIEGAPDLSVKLHALGLLQEVLAEVIRRYEKGKSPLDLRIPSLIPVLAIARGALRAAEYDPDRLAAARVEAWRVLDTFGHPALWNTLERGLAETVEEVTDHLALLELARRGFERGLTSIRSEGPIQLYVEAKFLHRVLSDRGARLNNHLAELVWRGLQELAPQVESGEGTARRFAQRAFVRLRALLEHQLLALGLQKSGVESTHAGLIEFVDPRTGRSVQMPPYRTRIYVYEQVNSATPSAVLDEWDLLRRHLFR